MTWREPTANVWPGYADWHRELIAPSQTTSDAFNSVERFILQTRPSARTGCKLSGTGFSTSTLFVLLSFPSNRQTRVAVTHDANIGHHSRDGGVAGTPNTLSCNGWPIAEAGGAHTDQLP